MKCIIFLFLGAVCLVSGEKWPELCQPLEQLTILCVFVAGYLLRPKEV